MNAMVLCPGCKRHVFAGEPACPFCGIGFASTAPAPMPAIGAEFSRAQRYVVGAALAATVATAGCSSPTVVRNPDEVGNVTVDVNDTQGDRDQRKSLEFATDPNNDEARIAEERARREREEQERRNRKDRVMHDDDENDDRRNDEWERRRRWEEGHRCVNNVCPPYGCVFPDEACDTVRV